MFQFFYRLQMSTFCRIQLFSVIVCVESDDAEAVFFRWDISVVCLTDVLKLTVTVFISLCFQTF